MQQMVQTLLGLRELPQPADAADAAALALCHVAMAPSHAALAGVSVARTNTSGRA
jgi:crossover junction endodeoxyribonuclease RuvC